jgi:hypothetical protein
MIVLHAAACGGQLVLWGERPKDLEKTPPSVGNGWQKPALHFPPPLVYDAGREKLQEALTSAKFAPLPRKSAFKKAAAWLPTLDGSPLASSSLIAEGFLSSSPAQTVPWAVTALPLDVEQVLDLLYACVGKHLLGPGVVVGEDLAYWTATMRFAGELVARQQFLPDVVKEGGEYRARWRPVLAGPDAERLRKLAGAMSDVA